MTYPPTPKRGLLMRPVVAFGLAGVWFLFGVVRFFTDDGPRRWFDLAFTVLVVVLYTGAAVWALRKARRERADL